MKKIDGRTKEGRALKKKLERKEARRQLRDAAALAYTPSGFTAALEPTPTVGGTGVYGAKYVPLDLNSDPVNAPNHYTQGGIETIDFIRAKLPPEMVKGYFLGNCLKYLSRAHFKGGVEDYKKAQVYLGWLVEAETK